METRIRLGIEGGRLRRAAGAALFDGFFSGLSSVAGILPRAQPARHGVEVIRDVPYRDTSLAEHRLDVYRPAANGASDQGRALRKGRQAPWPVVLYVHGGGFRILSKKSHWVMGLAYARRGYVVFNIDYRLAPRHRYPAAVEDSCEALRWVVEHAAEWGGDPSRIVLAGESAGANLVTSVALASSYARPEPWARRVFEIQRAPRAVVAACGILQVTDVARFRRRKKNLHPFLSDRLDEVAEAYLGDLETTAAPGALDLADPLLALERGGAPDRPLPAFFLPVGTRDILLDDTRRFAAALDRLGAASEAKYYEGELHAFHALVWRPEARRCWRDTFTFLDRHLG